MIAPASLKWIHRDMTHKNNNGFISIFSLPKRKHNELSCFNYIHTHAVIISKQTNLVTIIQQPHLYMFSNDVYIYQSNIKPEDTKKKSIYILYIGQQFQFCFHIQIINTYKHNILTNDNNDHNMTHIMYSL